MTLPWKRLAQRLRIDLFVARSCEGIARGGLEDALDRACTPTERLLIEAVLDDWERSPRTESWDWRYPHERLIAKVLEERGERAAQHPLYGELGCRFQALPWRRQIVICERLGLIRDDDEPEDGADLFERTFPRVLERGALRHFQIQIDHERDAAGLERRTASPPDFVRG